MIPRVRRPRRAAGRRDAGPRSGGRTRGRRCRALAAAALVTTLAAAATGAPIGAVEPSSTGSDARGNTRLAAPRPAAPTGPPAQRAGPAPPAEAGAARARLVAQTPFVAPTDIMTMEIDVTGAPEDATLTFVLYGLVGARGGRAQLDRVVEATGAAQRDALGPVLARIGPIPIANLERRAPTTVVAAFQIVPVDPEPLVGFRIGDDGVYPLTVTLSRPDGAGAPEPLDAFTTFVIRLPAGNAARDERTDPLRLSVVVPLRAPPALQADLTTQLDAAARDELARTVAVLSAHPGVPVTVQPTPETVVALASTETATFDALASSLTGRSVLSGTYVEVDTDSWLASGMRTELARQLALGDDTLDARLPRAGSHDAHTLVAGVHLRGDAYTALRELGHDRAVVPDEVLVPLEPRQVDPKEVKATLTRPFEIENSRGGRMKAVAADAKLRSRLRTTGNPVVDAQLTLADLATIWAEEPPGPGGMVLVLPPEDPRALPALDVLLGALEPDAATASEAPGSPGAGGTDDAGTPAAGSGAGTAARADSRPIVEAVTLDAMFALPAATTPATRATPASPLVRVVVPQDRPGGVPTMGSYPRDLAAAELSLAGFASMVGTTDPAKIAPLRHLLDVSGAAALDPRGRQSFLDAATAHVNEVAAGVRPPAEADGVTLAAAEAQIPVVIESTLGYPVAVKITFTSEKLDFPGGSSIVTTLQPGTNRLTVDVRPRASGLFTVDVRLTSPDSNIGLGSSRFTVRSAFSGIGLVLSIGAGFFLLVWWASHFRTARRARRLVDGDDGAGEGSAPRDPDDDQHDDHHHHDGGGAAEPGDGPPGGEGGEGGKGGEPAPAPDHPAASRGAPGPA